MHVVEATREHFAIIHKLAHVTWPHTFASILSQQQIEYMLQMMYSLPSMEDQVKQGHVFLLVKRGNEYLGYASYELQYKMTTKVKVHKIYILPTEQGKGVGALLMNEIERIARKHQHTHVSLNVNRQNQALQFYQHIGFTIVGKEDIDIGNGFLMEDYIMEKELR